MENERVCQLTKKQNEAYQKFLARYLNWTYRRFGLLDKDIVSYRMCEKLIDIGLLRKTTKPLSAYGKRYYVVIRTPKIIVTDKKNKLNS